jgi:hypothetical protein
MPKKKTLRDCQEKAKERDGECLSVSYDGSTGYMLWKCKNDHTWQATAGSVLNNRWCPYCAKNRPLTREDIVKMALRFGVVLLSENIKDKKPRWRCVCGNEWNTDIASIRDGHLCPKCAPERIAKTNTQRYGSANPFSSKEIKSKIKKTLLDKYGVDNPTKDRDIALKAAQKTNFVFNLIHWKTNESLLCQGTWERVVVEWLNSNKIDFLWQPQTFTMSDGSTYRPDFYLIKEDLWVEVKGWMRVDAEKKWAEFHTANPNSEIWDKKKLRDLKLINGRGNALRKI